MTTFACPTRYREWEEGAVKNDNLLLLPIHVFLFYFFDNFYNYKKKQHFKEQKINDVRFRQEDVKWTSIGPAKYNKASPSKYGIFGVFFNNMVENLFRYQNNYGIKDKNKIQNKLL